MFNYIPLFCNNDERELFANNGSKRQQPLEVQCHSHGILYQLTNSSQVLSRMLYFLPRALVLL